jgi:hypothetical protein
VKNNFISACFFKCRVVFTVQALLPPRSYGKADAAFAVDRLLMMAIRMPEIC